jgi:TRAP-type mannitol/chloroaromatic compound transport system substrate-binding protein
MQASSMEMSLENFAGSAEAWSQMRSEFPNIKVKEFPNPVLKAMKQAADKLYEQYAAKNDNFKKIMESQAAFMKKARDWSTISEYNYIKITSEL